MQQHCIELDLYQFYTAGYNRTMCLSTHVEMIHFSAKLLKMHFLCAARELPSQVTSACGSVFASNLSHLQCISALSPHSQ